ncbi:Glutathione transferase [Heracleum sosnowskyi]|uniref:Probable glutathione S-transferase n=1 Tax=Heracleum sosnowskyi TaxID=360622 RepID=A0AAD8I2F3_9APIA|nr:Glutathione transferase [Heracleum sosnowskyi]
MDDQEVKLLGVWGSCPSKRVEIALKMKGINYEFVAQDLSNKSPELLQYNPVHKKVPVLLHNGKPICESQVILEYIDETWKSGPSILPQDPHARALARFWARFIDDTCFPAIQRIKRSQGDDERERAIDEAMEHLKTLENELKGKKFFGGDEIGLVDIAANFVALWLDVILELVGIKLLTKEKFPRLCDWVDDYLNCSIIKETLPAREDLLDRFRAISRWLAKNNM